MKKIYGESALTMVPLSDGMVFAYCQERNDERMTVAFKHVSFESGSVTNVTADYFSTAKFGARYKSYLFQINNPVTCKAVDLSGGNVLLADERGSAKIIGSDIITTWTGELTHKGCPLSGAAADENSIWCSYKDSGTLIRYNLRTMRDELHLGGGRNSALLGPKGLWIRDGSMRVCDAVANKILEIDLNSYSMIEYRDFEEPVHQYIKVRSFELVLLDSGIYLL